jgi:sugar lactone lactonase YvrE
MLNRGEDMLSDFTIHVQDLGFPEGPVALADGSIAFVDLLHRKVSAYRDSVPRVICALPGSPNGMRRGPDGALYVVNNGGIAPVSLDKLDFADPQISGRIQRIEFSGTWTDFATDLPGDKPSRPNDLVFSPEGDIVFTDPQNWEVLGTDRESTYHGGQLLLATRQGEVRHLAKMTGFPNGLVFHPDGSLLVGLTMEHRIVQFPWLGGRVGEPRTWCTFDDGFNPDGMAFEGERLYVTGSVGDRIAIVDATAQVESYLDTGPGSDPTNLCISNGRLWVTLGLPGQLVSYRL